MKVSKKMVADMLMQYLDRKITLSDLVDWAEDMIREADLDPEGFEVIRDILAHMGLADVREFGLAWDDCYDYMHRLGYDVKIELMEMGQG
ncbi:MAG: hypothetical protein HZB81_06590 [Deltaproteobacteria bacterium]|nr:hypothetical protein [Deltaproteobacteria bacterium]MBI5875493.1 hypothetical protein [Deltaproteobacteria bacterium]